MGRCSAGTVGGSHHREPNHGQSVCANWQLPHHTGSFVFSSVRTVLERDSPTSVTFVNVCVCVRVCVCQGIISLMLKVRGSTFLLSYHPMSMWALQRPLAH